MLLTEAKDLIVLTHLNRFSVKIRFDLTHEIL